MLGIVGDPIDPGGLAYSSLTQDKDVDIFLIIHAQRLQIQQQNIRQKRRPLSQDFSTSLVSLSLFSVMIFLRRVVCPRLEHNGMLENLRMKSCHHNHCHLRCRRRRPIRHHHCHHCSQLECPLDISIHIISHPHFISNPFQ